MKTLLPVAVGTVALLAWEGISSFGAISPVILPSPSSIASVGIDRGGYLLVATLITLSEAMVGFLAATAIAVGLAVLFVYSAPVRTALYPYAILLKATPIIAVAPIVVLWAGNGWLSKTILAGLIAFFPILVSAVQGLSTADEDIVDLARSVNASWWTVLWRIRLPGSLPYLFPGLRVASTLSVVGAIIGEFTGATAGAGHIITTSSYYLDTPLMFAAVGCVASAALLFFGAVGLVERYIVFWQRTSWE